MKRDKIFHNKSDYEYANMRDMVEGIAKRYGDNPAYSFRLDPRDKEAQKKSYNDLRDDVRALGSEFISRGLTGKHIVLVGRLSYGWIVTYFATLAVGSVLVPLDKDWLEKDLADTAVKADVAFVICDADAKEKGEAISSAAGIAAPAYIFAEGEGSFKALVEAGKEKFAADPDAYFNNEINPDVLSLLVFTSGTTGKGKGVMLSQTNVLVDIADVLPYLDFSMKTVGVLPPHHTYGSTVSIVGHALIGTEVYLTNGIRYVQKELKQEKPGHLVLVPLYLETFYRKIMANIKDQGKDGFVRFMTKIRKFVPTALRRKLFAKVLEAFGGEVRMVVSGGAAINQEMIDTFETFGITILNGYGITECAPLIAANHTALITKGSVGQVVTCGEVKIDEPNEDGEGEILFKGPNVMLGYYKDEEATAEAMSDGYFRTGDYGRIGKDGALFITGRKKNLIILSNGKNVYPEEIESEFLAVPGLIDIIVYEGKSRRGDMYNTIVAEIYPDKEFMEKNGIADVQAYLQGFVDSYNKTAVPYKKIGVLKVRDDEFPKNTLRKIMRFKLDMTID